MSASVRPEEVIALCVGIAVTMDAAWKGGLDPVTQRLLERLDGPEGEVAGPTPEKAEVAS